MKHSTTHRPFSHQYLVPIIDNRKQVGEELETTIDGEKYKVKIIE